MTEFQDRHPTGELDAENLALLYRSLVDSIDAVVWEVNTQNDENTFISPQVERVLGYTPEEWAQSRTFWQDHIYPDDRERALRQFRLAAKERRSYQSEYRFQASDGRTVWLREIGTAIETTDGTPHMRGVLIDVTMEHKSLQLEQDRNTVLEMVARNEPAAVLLERIVEMIEFQQPEASASILILKDDVLHVEGAVSLPWAVFQSLEDVIVGRNGGAIGLAGHLRATVIHTDLKFPTVTGLDSSDLGYVSWHDGTKTALENGIRALWATPILGGEGQLLGVIVSHRTEASFPDFLQFRLLETAARLAAISLEHHTLVDRLDHQARHDALTGLPNRLALEDRLTQAVQAARHRHEPLALLLIDLDGFKHVNDTLGHSTGDRLIKAVSARLRGRLGENDTLARMGGDEFALVLTDLRGPEDIVRTAQQVLQALRTPFPVAGRDLFVTGSIGIALYPQDGDDALTLQRNADLAMYRAKNQGKNTLEWFTPALNASALERLELENALRQAIEKAKPTERGELEVFYQPQVNLEGRVVALEALLRWTHPQFGSVSPARFIPIAEDTSLIVPLGKWVLESVCHQIISWQNTGHTPVRVGVNVSPVQFSRSDFVQTVADALKSSGLDPQYLEIELTEGVVMNDLETTSARLLELRALGVSVSIDDFGTGYSSLRYLQRLPIDSLKIDRSFVIDLESDGSSRSLVQTIILLARQLGLSVVAEGVETQGQFDALREFECDRAQGYLFARPSSAENVANMLN